MLEAVLLIIHISAGHTDIQKSVTFSDAFEKIFSIVEHEGGVGGGIVVQDCLHLLSNLLAANVSNQSSFRETGFVGRLGRLLELADAEEDVPPYAKPQRDTNLHYVLRLVRSFVVPGGLGAGVNQTFLVNSGMLQLVLRMAWAGSSDMGVRAEALRAVADLIDGNPEIQGMFSRMYVSPPELQGQKRGSRLGVDEDGGPVEIMVIEALLELALMESSINSFDARFAACRCLEAYFNGNPECRRTFLEHAINMHMDADPSANALSCLLNLDNSSRGDPYRVWIASVVLIHLIYDDKITKSIATALTEGNAEDGEEVVTAIQSISANLVTALQHQFDPRICIGYLMLLCIWLYGDSDAVDDFLSEGASFQSVVGAVKEYMDPVVQGLCTFLLGILYEFSHSESPVPRKNLQSLILAHLGRDFYVNKITTLRSHPLIRDFEVSIEDLMPGHHHRKHGLPEVYFDQVFVEFFKDSCSQVVRAIDKDPNLETCVAADGVVKKSNGVNLAEMEALRNRVVEIEGQLNDMERNREETLRRLEKEGFTREQQQELAINSWQQKHTAAQSALQRAREQLDSETRKNREAAETARRKFESEAATRDDRNRSIVEEMMQRNRRVVEEKEGQLQTLRKQVAELRELGKSAGAEAATLKRQLAEVERRGKAAVDERDAKLDHMRRQAEDLVARTTAIVGERDAQVAAAVRQAAEEGRAAEERVARLEQELEQVRIEREAALGELQTRREQAKAEKDDALEELEKQIKQAKVEKDGAVEALEKARAEKISAVEERESQLRTEHALAIQELQQQLSSRDARLLELASEVTKGSSEHAQDLATAQEEHIAEMEFKAALATELEKTLDKARAEVKEKTEKLKAESEKLKAAKEKAVKADELQNELDDLFMILADLEEKRKADKV